MKSFKRRIVWWNIPFSGSLINRYPLCFNIQLIKNNKSSLIISSSRQYHSSIISRGIFDVFFGKKKDETNITKQEKVDGDKKEPLEKELEDISDQELSKILYDIDQIPSSTSRWDPSLAIPIDSFIAKDPSSSSEVVPRFTLLNPNIFLAPIRPDLMHRMILWQLAARRYGTQATKSRAQVRGGGRKPFQQKGTGRARQGSIRSPLWRHGGKSHHKIPRDYYFPLPIKVRNIALISALSAKYSQGKFRIVESVDVNYKKTKDFASVLKEKGWNDKLTALFYVPGKELHENFVRCSKNIQKLKAMPADLLLDNVFDLLKSDLVVLTTAALTFIEATLLASPATGVTKIYGNVTTANIPTENSQNIVEKKQEITN